MGVVVPRRIGAGIVAGAVVALLAAGCGGGGSPGTGGTASATGTGAASSPATAAGTAVTATEKEFSIVLSTTAFTSGTYTFDIQNQGTFPHNLNVKGPGVDGQVSPTVQPGATGQLTVTLQKGSYELWCSVDGHKDRGMDMMIQVG
jgi:hypothetical protein